MYVGDYGLYSIDAVKYGPHSWLGKGLDASFCILVLFYAR